MATDQKDGAEVDEYDGPWIERRIEWKCPDRKQHDVVLFGSWNRFRGGDELEYQGKQIYAVTAKLPLGNYVYRFMIDGEEWETNNATAKTVKDGIEYNTISVKQGGDSDDEDDEDEDEDNEADQGAKDDKSENAALIFDAKKQKFVVGNKRKGKRRGRPSMELDLGQNFDGEDADDEETTDGKTSDNASTTTDGAGGAADDGGKKKGKKRKKKTKKYTNKQNVDMAQEKEWARYVFVQQLRQQQQHNDEINRVKTLWKQERQVRVEMHKKVVKEKKKLQKDLAQLKAEKERLEKLNQISTDAETKLAVSLENDNKRLEGEVESMREQLKQAREEINNIRKQKNESEKSTRDNQSDWETKRKKLEGEIEEWKKEVANLQASKNSVQESLNALQTGNKKTMSIQSEQVADLQKRWEDSRKDNDKLQADFKKSRKDWEEKEAKYKKDLEKVSDELSQAQKEVKSEKANCSKLEEKNNKLKSENGKLKNSKEAEEKIKVEVERVTKEAGEEKAQLNDKIKSLNDKIEQLKADHAKEIDGVKQQSKAEIDALAAKSDSEMSSHLDKLKQEIETRDTQIKTQKDTIDKLEGQLSEQKTNCDNSDKKLASLSESHNALTKDKEASDKENASMREEIEKLQKELKSATDDASAQNDASSSKIENLEKELTASKERHTAEAKEMEDQNTKLNEKIAQLAEDLTKKAGETTEISAKMTEIEQELASYKSKDDANKVKIDGLEKSLADEKAEASNKAGEYQKQIDDVSAQMESLRSEKDGKITELEDTLAKVQHEMSDKLKEFHNAETKIKEMESQVEAQQKQFELQKDDYEKQLEGAREKDGRIHESCKKLNAQCEGLRGELKAIKDLKISQLEEMVNAFKEFSPVLDKVFAFNQNMVDDLMQKYKRELTLRRKYFNIVQDLRGNIRVFCRVRPILPFEIKKGDTSCLKFPEPGKIQVTDDKSQVHPFEFDQVYAPGTSQEAVSEDTTEYIQSVMDGYNVSIFAYGQTGSGKTYTMDGSPEEPGVNLRALKHLFKMAEERAPQFEYKIKVSILEIYNEKIRDLIVKKKKGKKDKDKKKAGGDFKILHLPDGSVEVQGLNWVSVKSDNDVIGLSELAKSQRTAGVTDMNAHSSRSHMLLIVDVHGFNLPANIEYLGKLYLVDLAGSERVKKSGATGQALKEAQNINKSLAALGDVMQSLQKKEKFIPYRNSTLTDLMTNSLGGNAKTVMFINCCPTARHAFETVSSLKFAQRVGKVELGQAKAKSKKKKSGK